MPDTVVETKLLPPRLRGRTVDRPRLILALGSVADAQLTLVSAPAGFGKTTLLAHWLAAGHAGRDVAWVALEESERDPVSFWTYVALAIDRAVPGLATEALTRLRSGQVPAADVLRGLINELSVLPDELTLVLDDYHLAEGAEVDDGMAFLVDHLPPQVHLVISTRADPALPLSRLRARGQLLELRAADLRFTLEETTGYLNRAHRLDLAGADVAALEARTEGWAAALQLAALSLRGRHDPSTFIAGFAGADRFVVDYLADEVLGNQSPEIRRFLLDTSVLDRMTGGLCDALTGRHDGHATLATLERQNLFLVPLDDHRRWYRYHHLFADVLRAHLLDERPHDAPVLHLRASDWYDRAGSPEQAVRHALAAGDSARAATLVELAIPTLRRQRREALICRWASDLPRHVVANRPVLAVGLIGGLTANNRFDGVHHRLDDLERMLQGPPGDLVVVDADEYSRIEGVVATYRSALALISGDLTATVRHADRAIRVTEPSDLLTLAAAWALTGIARWTDGDLDAAQDGYAAAADALRRAGHVADVLGCSITLADLAITRGRLRQAQLVLEDALRLAEADHPDLARTRGTADMLVGLSRIAWERGELEAVAEYLNRAEELGEEAGLPQNPYRWRMAMADLRVSQGDGPAAVELLAEAQRLYVGDYAPDVRPVAATRARLMADLGDLAGARAWAAERRLDAESDLNYRHEYEHVTVAILRLAEYAATGDSSQLRAAADLLDRLLPAAEAGQRTATVLEVLLLRARVHAADGHSEHALPLLERAVRLAEPEGHRAVFHTRHGAPGDLLQHLVDAYPERAFLRDLVRPTGSGMRQPSPGADCIPPSEGRRHEVVGTATHEPPLVEPLSERELDVLRCLCSELDGPAIARQLSVSLSTVRTHTQHIYTKLGVNSRRAAVRRAHQLALFSAHRR